MNLRLLNIFGFLTLLIFLLASSSFAENVRGFADSNQKQKYYQKMPKEKRKKIMDNYKWYNSLPPEERKKIKKKFKDNKKQQK